MKKFTDALQREWSVVVNVGTAKQVRDLAGVDLFNIFGSEAQKVFGDPIQLVAVLHVLVGKQLLERGITDESFFESLVGDSIENAANALMEEVAAFFPSSRREILMKSIQKSQTAATAILAKVNQKLDQTEWSQISLAALTK